jgi:hypothetical protein
MTLDDLVNKFAQDIAQHFPDAAVVVCTVAGEGDDTLIQSMTNMDAEDAIDLVTHCFETEADEDRQIQFQVGNPSGRLH